MATWVAFLGMFFDLGVGAWGRWVAEHAVFLGLATSTMIGVPPSVAEPRTWETRVRRRVRSKSTLAV